MLMELVAVKWFYFLNENDSYAKKINASLNKLGETELTVFTKTSHFRLYIRAGWQTGSQTGRLAGIDICMHAEIHTPCSC